MPRREFLSILALAAAAGMVPNARSARMNAGAASLYELPPFGNASFLHITDCHAQLLPIYYREPDVNVAISDAQGSPPQLIGEALLREFNLPPGSREAYAFTHLDFVNAAQCYGKVGGFAHLATLVNQLRESRPGALLLDGGDTWQGSAMALWTNGQDMADACSLLGVDVMTGHWEFTLGAKRVMELVNSVRDRTDFVAQNIVTADFEDPVFPAYVMRTVNGVPVAVIGQAYPYSAVANPRYFIPDWRLGIRDDHMQETVDAARAAGAEVVICLSHNGLGIDIKMASRVSGIDAILGGHTHDALPAPLIVDNAGGRTLVTNAGSNGKFLGVLDFDVQNGRIVEYRYHLLPLFANLLPPDPAMQALIERQRAPFLERLNEPLAVTDGLLYRRSSFNGTFDEVILDALMSMLDADVAFSPGFRWGTALLPGQTIRMEDLLAQTALTYPYTFVNEMTGAELKAVLEDSFDNLVHPDPYYRQGGDMVRTGGMRYACNPGAVMGRRIFEVEVAGKPVSAHRKYRVAGWAPVSEEARDAGGEPVWNVVAKYLRDRAIVAPPPGWTPRIKGRNGGV
jgi:sulfur-oxidizing protein SoxB